MRRNALVDSSSAIILYKSDLFEKTAWFYRVIMARSVFRELAIPGRAGAEDCERHSREGIIAIMDASPGGTFGDDGRGLDAGEGETILLYEEGAAEFIVLDDGKGVAWCRRQRIPHINALLVPRILKGAGIISAGECDEGMRAVMMHGRYSRRVIDYAYTCADGELARFS